MVPEAERQTSSSSVIVWVGICEGVQRFRQEEAVVVAAASTGALPTALYLKHGASGYSGAAATFPGSPEAVELCPWCCWDIVRNGTWNH